MSKRPRMDEEISNSLSEGYQEPMLAPNITRRKNRQKVSNGDDSEDDLMDVPSTAKKDPRDMTDYHPGKAKRNINGALQAVENKAVKAPAPEGRVDVVSVLLKAHMESKKAINSSNCFEKQTVLDFISKNSIMQESIQDMAFVLDSAVSVYTIRVDRTHGLTMAVKSNVNSGMKDGNKGHTATDEFAPSDTKEAKKQAAKSMMSDWKTKFDSEVVERELTPHDENEEDEEEEEKGEGKEEREEDSWLRKVPDDMDDFDGFLDSVISHRKQKNAKLNTFNHVLTEDRDVLLDRNLKQMSSNEYYQKAVSRYGEGTSDSLLMNNAKFTSDGKAYVIHARIPKESSKIPDSVPVSFSRGVASTLCNALSENPKRAPNDLLPTAGELMTSRGDYDSDDEDEYGTMTVEAPPECSTSGDVTMLPDMTIADVTMMPNRTMLPTASSRRKTAVFRGKELNQAWIADDFDLGMEDSLYAVDELELTRIHNLRKQKMLPPEARGRMPAELNMTEEEFRERMRPIEMSGIADELRELDNIWNAQVVRRVVTQTDTEEMFRHAERTGGSEEEVRALKKRILPPGNYIFFMEPDGPNPLIPVDQWADEGTDGAADVSGGDDVFYDANDDDMFGAGGFSPGGSNLNVADETSTHHTSDDERTANAVRAVMEHNPMDLAQEPLQLDAPNDEIPDVPVNPGAVMESPDDALRNLGKEDDAHWKGNKVEPEKKERAKKEKKPAEEKVSNVDSYFTISTASERKAALKRFKIVTTGLERDEKAIFMKRKPIERRLYQQYDFQLFLRSGLISHGRYHGMRFQRVGTTDERFNRVVELLGTDEEEGEVDDVVGREWMQLFSGLILRDNAEEEEDSFHSANDSHEEQDENGEEMEEVDDYGGDGGVDVDEEPVDMDRDSFHSAVQVLPDLGSPGAVDVPPPPVPATAAIPVMKQYEDIHGEESDEEEGEVVYMMDQKVVIKNTNIDQSKVKSYLKGILTNPMMDVDSLRAVSRSAEDASFLAPVDIEKDATVMDNSLLNDSNVDPLEVSRMVFAPVDEQSQITGSQLKHSASSSQDALTNAVVLSDFDVQGTHTLTSLMACLPFRAQRPHEKSMHVSFAFSIALQMCNENTLQCVQNKDGASSKKDEDWMGDFIIRNGSSTAGFGTEACPNDD